MKNRKTFFGKNILNFLNDKNAQGKILVIAVFISIFLLVFIYAAEWDYTGTHWDTSASGNTDPTGIWGDGTYIWVADYTGSQVYQYWQNGTYTGNNWDTSAISGNANPQGIWGNGTFLWIVDSLQKEVYQYWQNGTYTETHFDTNVRGGVMGIWGNGTHFWISDYNLDIVTIYTLSGTYVSNFSIASSGNTVAQGLYSNGTYIWIADYDARSVYQYWQNGTYTNNFYNISGSNTGPTGIWGNGTYYWVVDEVSPEVYIYEGSTFSATPDTTAPTYNSVSHNSSITGQSTKFSINVSDETSLNNTGQYIFSTNNSGVWVNDSAVNFTTTPSWANVTKVLNSTGGISIGYRWYITDNAGNMNVTGIYTSTTLGFYEGFEGGNNGTFDLVVEYGGGTVTYNNQSLLTGIYSANISMTESGGASLLRDMGYDLEDSYIKFDIYFPLDWSYGNSTYFSLLEYQNSSEDRIFYITLYDDGAGNPIISYSGDPGYASTDITLNLSYKNVIEVYVSKKASGGNIQLWVNNNNQSNPDYDSGSIDTGESDLRTFLIGSIYSDGNTSSFFIDDVRVDSTFMDFVPYDNTNSTPPRVTIVSPSSGYASTSATVLFNVTTNKNSSCNYTFDSFVTNFSMISDSEGLVHTASPSLSNGNYVLNYSCEDLYSNVNKSTGVLFSVNVVAAPESTSTGGGGGGTVVSVFNHIINESNIYLDMQFSSIKDYTVSIKNTGTSVLNLSLSQSSLTGKLAFSENYLDLLPGETKELTFTFFAPNETGTYSGVIYIGGRPISVSLNVLNLTLLFDSNIVVLNKDYIIRQGEVLKTSVELIPKGSDARLDVVLNYAIKDYSGNVYLTRSESVLVEQLTKFDRNFDTGILPPGDYVVALELVYPNGVAPSSAHFKVIEFVPTSVFGKIVFYLVNVILIILIIIIAILVKNLLSHAISGVKKS